MRAVVGEPGGEWSRMSWAEELPPGTIGGDTSTHGPGVRFGVVLAPEPSERVRRITSDDPAIRRPAVDELVREAWSRHPAVRQ
jgi:hypothetical protein